MQENLNHNSIEVARSIEQACKAYGRDSSTVKLLAATKTVPAERINLLPELGITLAGENRVQEFLAKYEAVKGIEWHFVGALQTNKVKYIIDKVSMIHSVDRVSLVDEINFRAKQHNVMMPILIEINAGCESSKSGVHEAQLEPLYQHVKNCSNVSLQGFMPVLPIGAEESLYARMYGIFEEYAMRDPLIKTLSMGMSDDYITAIKYGATLVRLGSCLFGERHYTQT